MYHRGFNDFPQDFSRIKIKIPREEKLLPYSDEFVQDLHLLPFSPNLKHNTLKSDTYNVSLFPLCIGKYSILFPKKQAKNKLLIQYHRAQGGFTPLSWEGN